MTDAPEIPVPPPPADPDLEMGDDPVDEPPFTAEELLRLAKQLLP